MEVEVGETDWLPEVASEPLQAPEAVQEVALVLLQLRVLEEPLVIVEGEAEIETVGAGVPLPVVLPAKKAQLLWAVLKPFVGLVEAPAQVTCGTASRHGQVWPPFPTDINSTCGEVP